MLPAILGGLGLAGKGASVAIGYAWDTIALGIYHWLASGLVHLLEWVWGMLDAATTPRVTDGWFMNELAGQIVVLALAITIAMMLASAAQAALAGRPDQIGDALKEGPKAVAASALTITVIDLMIRVVDEASAQVWKVGRDDMVTMVEVLILVVKATGPLGSTFIGPLLMLLGLLGLTGLTISLMMRSALIYVAAALAPLVWASSVLPVMRGASRRLVHLLVALIFSKLAIVVTLVIAVKLIANLGDGFDITNAAEDSAAAIGALMTGFTCFLVAAVSPFVLYKLMPTVEGAAASTGIAGGWGRSALAAGQAAMMAYSAGAATRAVAGQAGVAGQGRAQGLQGVQGTLTATGGASSEDGQGTGGAGTPAGAQLGRAATRSTPSSGSDSVSRSGEGTDTGSQSSGHGPSAESLQSDPSSSPSSTQAGGSAPVSSRSTASSPAATAATVAGGSRDQDERGAAPGDGAPS